MSITSLQSLYADLQSEFECKYILTHRLNKDCLESFFSQVRSRGGLHDHPSPLMAIYRVRCIVLGKNPGVVQERQNIMNMDAANSEEVMDEYLVAKVIKEADVAVTAPTGPSICCFI